jgi:membrane fusion protein, multidrug efflux system
LNGEINPEPDARDSANRTDLEQPGGHDHAPAQGKTTPSQAAEDEPVKSWWRNPRRLIWLIIFVMLAAAIAIPVYNYMSSYVDTDDAQINGHEVAVSSRINGTVLHVYVINTEAVNKGQLLADIDPRDFEIAVENTRAQLAQARAAVESSKADYQVALGKVDEDEATKAKAEYDVPRLR